MKLSKELTAKIAELKRMSERVQTANADIAGKESQLASKRNAWHEETAKAMLAGKPAAEEPDDMKSDEDALASMKNIMPALTRAYEAEAREVASAAHDEMSGQSDTFRKNIETVRTKLYEKLFDTVVELGAIVGSKEAHRLLDFPSNFGALRTVYENKISDGNPVGTPALMDTVHRMSQEISALLNLPPSQLISHLDKINAIEARIQAFACIEPHVEAYSPVKKV